jgi:hypothetical protein
LQQHKDSYQRLDLPFLFKRVRKKKKKKKETKKQKNQQNKTANKKHNKVVYPHEIAPIDDKLLKKTGVWRLEPRVGFSDEQPRKNDVSIKNRKDSHVRRVKVCVSSSVHVCGHRIAQVFF